MSKPSNDSVKIPLIDLQNLEEGGLNGSERETRKTGHPTILFGNFDGKAPSRKGSYAGSIIASPDDTKRTAELKKKRNELFECAGSGDEVTVRRLLMENDKLVFEKDLDDMTALHFAARYVNPEVVRTLLEFKANPNIEDKDGWRPLHYAAKYFRRDLSREGDECEIGEMDMERGKQATRDIIQMLCRAKTDVNAVDFYQCSALHYAAMRGNSAAATELLKNGADPNLKDSTKLTPLLLSCVHGTDEVVEILFSKSDKRVTDVRLNSALHILSQQGRLNIINVFFERAPLDSRAMLQQENNEGKTALHLAVEGDHSLVVQRLLQLYGKNNLSLTQNELELVHLAAGKGYVAVVKCLIEEAHLKVDIEDDLGRLPIHEAALHNHPNVVEFLLEKDATTIEATESLGFTPLLIAATTDALECIEVLLKHRAKFQVVDRSGRNIVHLAAKYNSMKVLKHILDHMNNRAKERAARRAVGSIKRDDTIAASPGRVDFRKKMINKVDQNQDTPMHTVCSNGYLESVRLLYHNGASIIYINENEEIPLHLAAHHGCTDVVEQLLEWEKKLTLAKDDQGNTPLHRAAKEGHDRTVSALIEAGSDIAAKNVYDESALDVAIKTGQLPTVKILIERGGASTNPNEDRGCTTPLHLAARNGYDAIVQYLLQCNATIDRRDENEQTALDVAIANDHQEVARILVSDSEWEKLLKSPGRIPITGLDQPRDTPMRQLIKKFPEVAKIVFDKCRVFQTAGETEPFDRYIYEYLDDTWMLVSEDGSELLCDASPYSKQTDRLLDNTRPYSQNYDLIYSNHPLRIMVSSEKENLLSHPLVISLLKHKWNSMGRYVYYFGLSIYILFIILFTIYISQTPAPFNVLANGSYVDISKIMADVNGCPKYAHPAPFILKFCSLAVIILSAVQILKEIFQLYQRRTAYFSFENALELFIYISALLVVVDVVKCNSESHIRTRWQWTLAAACAFLQWLNLLLLVRKLPRFGIYVVMFFDICKTFMRFFLIFSLFVVAFSIAFFIILQNRPEFSSFSSSILKTTVMMIGEFEFTAIFHGDQETHTEKVYAVDIAYPLFLFFAIVMTILLMNLLVGLAVDDIKSVQEKAALKRLSMQVDLVLQVECNILNFIRRKTALGAYVFYPHRKGLWQRFRNHFGSGDSAETDTDYGAPVNEKELQLERALQLQRMSIDTLQTNVDVMHMKQLEMEDMLKLILEKMDRLGEAREDKRDETTV